jgi:hypothetical protein
MPHVKHARARSVTGALIAAARDIPGRAWLDALGAVVLSIGCGEVVRSADPGRVRGMCERVWQWEDEPGRTLDHVLEAFERAKEHL